MTSAEKKIKEGEEETNPKVVTMASKWHVEAILWLRWEYAQLLVLPSNLFVHTETVRFAKTDTPVGEKKAKFSELKQRYFQQNGGWRALVSTVMNFGLVP